ncbi:polyketide synthase [Aureobasidium pullulans]|nr:polyketide synthase [Aureobasidium pullulans]
MMETDNDSWASEPIAVIGMSCKFSGGASDPEKLWDLMASGKTGWSEIPKDRFNLSGVYHPNHERISTTHVKGGHFLDQDVAAFDAAFFNYSAEMAQTLDPQFRLQLESTYEALENAGLPLAQVMGSQTSVYAGVFTHDYQEGMIRDEDKLPRFNVVGTWSPMSSNRISHFFDFRGASMTLETGCSTTLVALHQAVQSLRNREADMSVVTGANVMLNPDTFKVIGSLGMLSPDGRSWAFDSRANGYGRGEGVATIIVKRLSDALAANDPIRAVIRETALNQDGKTDTITTPSGDAQVELMRECYRRAGLDPRGTQYFEAHGTGTPVGDVIEAKAMTAVFSTSEDRQIEDNYLRIGSVKTNVGHTEAVSGLAAIIKGVMCLEKGLIPPTVNFERPNPKLKLDDWCLKVVQFMEPWPESLTDGPRRMSINNFGYGGANAHVILESADPWTLPEVLDSTTELCLDHGHSYSKKPSTGTTDDSKVLILSARDERGCQQMVSNLQAYLEDKKSLRPKENERFLHDLAYTLGQRRTQFPWVAAHQVRICEEGTLDAAIQALDSPKFKPRRRGQEIPRIGMIFTGQGAQWHAMGRELLTSYPIFRESIDESERHLHDLGADWSLLQELNRDAKTTNVHTTKISIPICVALQIALVHLLESWGIKPTAVSSHSSGEISAAYAVGALTHRQAIATAYYRAMIVTDESKTLSGAVKGAMAAVGLGVEAVQPYLNRLTEAHGRAGVACVNSPQSVTISGDSDAVQEIENMCKEDGVFARRLKVQQAYHSHQMNPFAELYRETLRKEMARDFDMGLKTQYLQRSKQNLKAAFSSAVTGGRISDAKDIASPDHWVGSLVQPVEFVDAFTEMVLGDPDDPSGRSVDVLLEVGPHTALGGPIREILSLPEFEGLELPYWGCLTRDEHAGDSMRAAAINLFREGLPLNMDQINFPTLSYDDESPQVLTDLPAYPWHHSIRHWQESRVSRAIRAREQPPHELLGMPVAGNDPSTAVWRRILRVTETPWIRDHVIQGSIVYPGSGYICLAIEASKQLEMTGSQDRLISGFRLRDMKFLFALVVPDNSEGVEIRTTLHSVSEQDICSTGWRRFEVSSVTPDNHWTLHAKGMIRVEWETTLSETKPRRSLSTYTRQPNPRDLFANLSARGINHGPLFQNITRIVQDGREPRSLCEISIRHEASSDTDPKIAALESLVHPITLDAVVVAFYSVLPSVGALEEDPKLPDSVASMWVSNNISREIGQLLSCDTSLLHHDNHSGIANITVYDGQTDAAVLKIESIELASLGRGSGATARQDAANKGIDIAPSRSEQQVCSKLVWGPDLSLRNPLALAQIKKQLLGIGLGQEAVAMEQDPLVAIKRSSILLRQLSHKEPRARILQVGHGLDTLATRLILEALGTPKAPLMERWHIASSTSESLLDAREQLSDWDDLLEYSQLDIEQNLAKQDFTPGSFDIVLAMECIDASEGATGKISNLRTLLKPGGALLFTPKIQGKSNAELVSDVIPAQNEDTHHQPFTTSSWDRVLRDAGFGGLDLEVSGPGNNGVHGNSIMMAMSPSKKDVQPSFGRADFVLITSNRAAPPEGFVDMLSQQIQVLTNSAPEHHVLEQADLEVYKAKSCIFLGEINRPLLAQLDSRCMNGIRAMVTQCNGLLWITSGGTIGIEAPERALNQGFLRALRNEYIGRRFITLDLDVRHIFEQSNPSKRDMIAAVVQVLMEGFGDEEAEFKPREFEYAERDGILLIPRYYKDEQYNNMVTGPTTLTWGDASLNTKDDHDALDGDHGVSLESLFQDGKQTRLVTGIPGHLDTLVFVQREDDQQTLSANLVEIAPRAWGVCSRDVLAALGQLEDRAMGFECAGIVSRVSVEGQAKGFRVGDRVMAALDGASFATPLRASCDSVVQIPSDMDFTHAASLPIAFVTAHAALMDTARLQVGQSILIHAATGATGQAAIMLAKHLGVTEIYVTAESEEKRDLLHRDFNIPAEHIFNCRDDSFAHFVMAATNGRGVDTVLSSLPASFLQASLSVVAPSGYLIDVGRKRIQENKGLVAIESFSRGISIVALDISTIIRRRGPDVQRALVEMLRLTSQQAAEPIRPITVYPMRDIESAFRFVKTDEHIGHVVVSAGAEEKVHLACQPKGLTTQARLRPDASYLVVGGVGGIGRSIACWLFAHGARNLILLSRSAGDLDSASNKHSAEAGFVNELREAGCRVKPVSCDISLACSLAIALKTCVDAGLPPVRGVIQGAMLLRDAVFEQMTLDDWHSGLRPKLYGTWNLHTEFSQPGSLDFFVMLSSVSGVLGIASQANYAAGGSYEDAMAHWRQSRGLPGVALDLGPISDIGYVSTSSKVADRLRKDGDFTMLDEDIVLRALNAAVTHPINSRPQIIVGLNSSAGPQWDANGRSQLSRDARFLPLRPHSKPSAAVLAADTGSLLSILSRATSVSELTSLIADAVVAKLAEIFMIPTEDIDTGEPPSAYGVDSLIAVELRNMLVLQAKAEVSIFDILGTQSLNALAGVVAAKSRFAEQFEDQ